MILLPLDDLMWKNTYLPKVLELVVCEKGIHVAGGAPKRKWEGGVKCYYLVLNLLQEWHLDGFPYSTGQNTRGKFGYCTVQFSTLALCTINK